MGSKRFEWLVLGFWLLAIVIWGWALLSCTKPTPEPVYRIVDPTMCVQFVVDIDVDHGVQVDAGVWAYRSVVSQIPCDAGAK